MDVRKILIAVKFWRGIGCENIYIYIFFFLVWKFLVMEIDELNFCVAEPQESR